MSRVQIHIRDESRWQNFGGAQARGAAFLGGQLLGAAALAQRLGQCPTPEDFRRLVREFNGFFAAVCPRPDGAAWIAVDRARSMPLFYGELNGSLLVSDDAHWISGQLGEGRRDPAAELEFELAGYNTGRETIHPQIKQLQAGELLVADAGSGPAVHTERYFRYEHEDGPERSEEELREELDAILRRSFERLCEFAKGRCIAVPLSGGHDSRLIVLMLRRLGYDNVVAFSYGRAGNTEAAVSRRVASALGVPWRFVEYSESSWRRWFGAPERRAYYDYADGLCSLPVIQDWPAIWELKRQALIPDNAIIVPGHSADAFPASRKTRSGAAVYQDRAVVRETVLEAIYRYSYSLWDWSDRRAELAPLLAQRIEQALGEIERFVDSASAVEAWGIQERQAKFITNNVRAYEFWGYDWWLPFWDSEFATFWMRAPHELRIGRRFSRSFISKLYGRMTGEEPPLPAASRLSAAAAIIRGAGERLPSLSRLYERLRAPLKYGTHALAWYGIVPRKVFLERFRGPANINSFLVLNWLGRLELLSEEETG